MRYLERPRGKGYSLRIKTPEALVGAALSEETDLRRAGWFRSLSGCPNLIHFAISKRAVRLSAWQ